MSIWIGGSFEAARDFGRSLTDGRMAIRIEEEGKRKMQHMLRMPGRPLCTGCNQLVSNSRVAEVIVEGMLCVCQRCKSKE